MAGTQLQIVQAVQDIVSAVSGIREAPDYPPEQLGDFPFAVAFPGEGVHSFGVVGERLFLGNIILEIHVSRVDLPFAVENVIGFGDTIPNALMKFIVTAGGQCLNGTADTFENITQTFGQLNWGETQTLGWRFTLTNVKARYTIA
jgi:hypothetical protein